MTVITLAPFKFNFLLRKEGIFVRVGDLTDWLEKSEQKTTDEGGKIALKAVRDCVAKAVLDAGK